MVQFFWLRLRRAGNFTPFCGRTIQVLVQEPFTHSNGAFPIISGQTGQTQSNHAAFPICVNLRWKPNLGLRAIPDWGAVSRLGPFRLFADNKLKLASMNHLRSTPGLAHQAQSGLIKLSTTLPIPLSRQRSKAPLSDIWSAKVLTTAQARPGRTAAEALHSAWPVRACVAEVLPQNRTP